jgi:tetratricopeptide (TPR) repeat protein
MPAMKRATAPRAPRAMPSPPLTPDALATALAAAAAHRVAHRYDEAVASYAEVERRNPEMPDAPYFLALIDLARDRLQDAAPRLERLTRRHPAIADVWEALAYTLERLGRYREAIAAYERLSGLDPRRSRGPLATALEVVGRLDEATAIEQALTLRPETRVQGLVALAKRDPASITFDEAVELARTADAGTVETRINAGFALGLVREANGDYDEAFAAFDTANRLKRTTLTGEIEAPEAPVIGPRRRMLHPDEADALDARAAHFVGDVFTAEFLAANAGRGHHLPAPIFVVGMPRSGSTLVEQVLSSHRRVQGLGESDALGQAVADAFPYAILGEDPPDHFRRLAEAYLQAQHARGWRAAPRFVDKMLYNHMRVGMIHLMLPNAVILHAVRDPVDTCLGIWRQNFDSGNELAYDLADIGRAYARYRRVMAHWADVLPGRAIDVRYEDLVSAPDRQIRWLVEEACGLDWDPACLRFYDTKRPVRTASVAQVRQPIFTSGVERWRRYEAHLGPLFEALGPYAPPRG